MVMEVMVMEVMVMELLRLKNHGTEESLAK